MLAVGATPTVGDEPTAVLKAQRCDNIH